MQTSMSSWVNDVFVDDTQLTHVMAQSPPPHAQPTFLPPPDLLPSSTLLLQYNQPLPACDVVVPKIEDMSAESHLIVHRARLNRKAELARDNRRRKKQRIADLEHDLETHKRILEDLRSRYDEQHQPPNIVATPAPKPKTESKVEPQTTTATTRVDQIMGNIARAVECRDIVDKAAQNVVVRFVDWLLDKKADDTFWSIPTGLWRLTFTNKTLGVSPSTTQAIRMFHRSSCKFVDTESVLLLIDKYDGRGVLTAVLDWVQTYGHVCVLC
jgi:hypothetical protein